MDTTSLKRALTHLRKDPRLKPLIAKYPAPTFDSKKRGTTAFHALTRAIIFQQLSGKAAGTILRRFLAIYGGVFPSPQELTETDIETLRAAGVSGQKASYLHDLAAKFLDGTVNPRRFPYMTDEEVFEHVVSVKGIGPWTCDMFLMDTLGRPDILPTGDLGIQNGMQKLFNLRTRPTPEKMEKLARPWQPYRTSACHYLWRLADEGNINRPKNT